MVLRQLDFEVEVYNDLPYKEIERILEQASMEDHSDADCVFVTGQKKAGSFLFLWVLEAMLRIHAILVWIRIRVSMPLIRIRILIFSSFTLKTPIKN